MKINNSFHLFLLLIISYLLFSQKSSGQGSEDYNVYFPLPSNRIFHYDIWLNPKFDKITTNYYFQTLPVNNGYMRGHVMRYSPRSQIKNPVLIYKISSSLSVRKKPYDFEGFRMQIIRDDIKIFGDSSVNEVFWIPITMSSSESSTYAVMELIISNRHYDANSHILIDDPYCVKSLFFIGDPSSEIQLDNRSFEKLIFVGKEKLPKSDIVALHYRRVVINEKK